MIEPGPKWHSSQVLAADLDYKDYAPGIMIVAPIHNRAQNFWKSQFFFWSKIGLQFGSGPKHIFIFRLYFSNDIQIENQYRPILFWTYKTCSCRFVLYFQMLFWDDIMIIWNENIVYFLTEITKLFWTNKKFVYSLVYFIVINKLS